MYLRTSWYIRTGSQRPGCDLDRIRNKLDLLNFAEGWQLLVSSHLRRDWLQVQAHKNEHLVADVELGMPS